MSIVKMHNKKTGVTYVYESTSYWDKEKQQPRNRRKLIGKIDPETGEVVPTGRPGRPSSAAKAAEVQEPSESPDSGYANALSVIDEKNREIEELKDRIRKLEEQCRSRDEAMDRIRSIVEESGNRGRWTVFFRNRRAPRTRIREPVLETDHRRPGI